MALAKELQSEGSCSEKVILDDACENDSQQDQSSAPANAAFSRNEGAKLLSPGAVRVRTYSIDSGELDIKGLPIDASGSIRSVKSNPPLGEGFASNLGEADTVDETVSVMLNDKEDTKPLDDESSIDTVDDGNFAAKAIEGVEEKREQRKNRIEEMDRRRQGKALKKPKGLAGESGFDLATKINNTEMGFIDVTSNIDAGDDAITAIEDLLATVYNGNDADIVKYAAPTIPVEITTTKKAKKKKKKKIKKSAKRKERKQKGDKSVASDSSSPGWWNLSTRGLSEDANDYSITGSRTRKNMKASYDWSADSLRSAGSRDSGNGSCSASRSRKGRATSSLQSNSFRSGNDDDAYSLRSIVKDGDCEDINSGHVGTTRAIESVHSAAKDNDDRKEEKKYSGYGGAMGLNDMIAEAVARRQERLASNKSPKLPFQSPCGHKESLSSRLQNKRSFAAPLSPESVDTDDVSISEYDLESSTNNDNDSSGQNKNSGHGSAKSLNEMIADAVAKRQERLESSKSPKLPFQSPSGHKGSLSSRLRSKDFASPISPQTSQYDATSAVGAVECSSSTDIAADESEITKEPKNFKKFGLIALNEEQRKEDKETHRKIFMPVAGEAATYGRLVRLEEHVVESQGGARQHSNDRFSTWTGPKLRTDDRRSSALRAIQEAAAMGRMKSLIPKIVTNYDENDRDESDDYFDIENQTDEYGGKICRTNFLLDRHVKEILQRKKKRMFACSDAAGNRDDKIASYKDFDDVKLPTEVLPTYDRVLGRRTNNKSFSTGADLALLRMQLSDRNLQLEANDNDEDEADIKSKQLRVIDRISSAVAASACERDARLQQPRAKLKVTRKCMCPYCKEPNPYQTHKYKRLMYPDRFNDNTDQNDYCQEIGETIGKVSDAAKADKSSYTISPGGRKKKIIRIVRRKRRRPKGLVSPSTGISSEEKNRVIDGISLTPEELDILTKQLQTQGASGMTTEELVLIANALRDRASTTSGGTPIKEEQHKVRNQIALSPGQQESAADLSKGELLQAASNLKLTGLTTDEMIQLDSKLLVSPQLDELPECVDPMPRDTREVADDMHTNNLMMGSNSKKEKEREINLAFAASLPFIDITGDSSSTPTAPTQDVTVGTSKRQQPEATNHEQSENIAVSRKSTQAPNKSKNKYTSLPKSPSLRKPVLPKSPSLRKPRKMLSAPPELSNSKKVPRTAHITSTKYYSPQGNQKKKVARRRPKEAIQSPIQGTTSNLPAPPSKTGEAPRKKSLRSRLKNLTGSSSDRPQNKQLQASDDPSQGDKDRTPRVNRRGRRRSHSLHARPESLPASIDASRDEKKGTLRSERGGRGPHSLTPGPGSTLASDDGPNGGSRENEEKVPSSHSRNGRIVNDSMEALLPRARDRESIPQSRTSTSDSHAELKKQSWTPLRRAPTRTQSLPIARQKKVAEGVGQETNKPEKVKSLLRDKSLAVNSTFLDGAIRKPPYRTRSLQDSLQPMNNAAQSQRVESTTTEAQQEVPKESFDRSMNNSPKQLLPSPNSQKKSLTSRSKQKQISPISPRINLNLRNTSASKPIPPIPSMITISFDTGDTCVDSNSNSTEPTALETPEGSQSSQQVQKHKTFAKKPRKKNSLEGQRPKLRKCRSLDAHRISEDSRTRSRSKPKKGKKADVTVSEEQYKGTKGKASHPSSLSNPKPSNSNRQGPFPTPKRGRSLDRHTITRKERGKGARNDTSLDRLRKNLTPRNWFKKGTENSMIDR